MTRLAELIDAYLSDRRRSGASANTLRQYTGRLKPLRVQLGERTVASLTRRELLDWLDRVNRFEDGRENAPDTIRANLVCLQQLEKFGIEEGDLPAALLRPKDYAKPASRRRDRLPTSREVEQLLELAGPEWTLIYQALRHTGARPSELANADIEQIETTDAGRLLILRQHKTARKTGAPRRIPIGKTVATWFDAAIGDRITGPIFLDSRGHRWTVPNISREFRRLRRKLGLSEDLVLYSARHEFGSAISNRVGIFQAKELLGHSSVTTTQRYAHMTDDARLRAQENPFGVTEPPPATSDAA